MEKLLLQRQTLFKVGIAFRRLSHVQMGESLRVVLDETPSHTSFVVKISPAAISCAINVNQV